MTWYVIAERPKGSKSDKDWKTVTEPDNHYPSVKIQLANMKRDNPMREFRYFKTNY